jgi:S-layer protein
MAFLPTNASQVQQFAVALYGIQVGTATMAAVQSDITLVGGLNKALNAYYAVSFGSSTTASVAATVAANLGLTGTAATDAAAYITAVLNGTPANARGEAIQGVLSLFSTLTSNATFGTAATAWNNKVTNAVAYTGAGDVVAGSTQSAGTTFKLSAGIDTGASFTGGANSDTFVANTDAGALTLTSLDSLDGGAGNDSLTAAIVGNLDTTTAVATSIKNIESANLTSTGTVTVDSSAWAGLTSLNTSSVGNTTATAAATTDATLTVAAPTGAGAVVFEGGNNAVVSVVDTAAANTATGNTTVLGATTAVAGTVTVTQNETHVASTGATATALTTGSITVNGGTTVVVNNLTTSATGDHTGDILTTGTVAVNGKGTATSVSVTQSAATVAYAAAGDKYKITNGVVTITDKNTADKVDTIKSVSLTNFGASTITGNVLETLTLNGSAKSTTGLPSGTFGISQSASVKTAGSIPTALTLNATGFIGAVTDTNDQYKTLNIAAASAATIADLDFTNVTALNISGAGVATISALTALASSATITTTGAGAVITPALGTSQVFTGGEGKDTITVGATTKAITTGAGDDKVTTGSAIGTGGSVDAGDGVDTLSLSAADAVTASATTTFEAQVSNFEKLAIAAVAATGTVDLANLDDLNDVAVAGVAAGQALTVSNARSGVNVRFADATQTATTVALANTGTADVANVFVTTADNASTHTLVTLTGFETINIDSANTETTDDAVANLNTITTLTDDDATTVVVTGNAGLTLGTFTGTKVTSFDASAVTAGAVTYATGALAAAATIKGGAGADVLSAASATKSVTLSGNAGNDTLTGSKAADSIDGGAGTDTYVADATEQAGSSTTRGQVVNLSDAALTSSGIFTLTGTYLTSAATTVAANTATYLFNGESSTNASTIDTLTSIENVTGSANIDYIVGSADANVITGLAGADFLDGGAGADVYTYTAVAQGGNVAALGATALTAGDTIVSFVSGTDKIDLSATATGTAVVTSAAAAINLTTNGVVIVNTTLDVVPGTTAWTAVAAAMNTAGASTFTIAAGGVAYFAILDSNGAGTADDQYNIFEVSSAAGLTAAALVVTTETVSLVGTLTAASLAAGDFVL